MTTLVLLPTKKANYVYESSSQNCGMESLCFRTAAAAAAAAATVVVQMIRGGKCKTFNNKHPLRKFYSLAKSRTIAIDLNG